MNASQRNRLKEWEKNDEIQKIEINKKNFIIIFFIVTVYFNSA